MFYYIYVCNNILATLLFKDDTCLFSFLYKKKILIIILFILISIFFFLIIIIIINIMSLCNIYFN